jgi:hypothetical protein
MRLRLTSAVLASAIALGLSTIALAERTAPEARWAAWQQQQKMQNESLLRGLKWRSIGPSVQGGRVVDIESVPNQPYTFYVAYASGGVWKTVNNGQSFSPLSDGLPSMISGDIAVDPNAPETLWIGTGEPNASRSSYAGLGVFRSTDGGKNFESKGLLGADRIARVLIDPRNSKRILVAVQGPLYTEGGMRGVYLSEDAGDTWRQTLKTDNAWSGATELVFHPKNPDVVYAATWDKARSAWNFRESGVGSAVYKSIDGGLSFKKLTGFPSGAGVGRIGLAVSAAQPDWLYVSVDQHAPMPEAQRVLGDSPFTAERFKTMTKEEFLRQDQEQIEQFLQNSDFPIELDAAKLIEQIKSDAITLDQIRAKLLDGDAALFDTSITGLELYRSEDAGNSFNKRHAEPIRDLTFTYGYYFSMLAVAPDNAEQVTLLGMPLAISDDGGKTFSGRLNQREVHVDHHVWKIDPNFPKRIFNGNDGGADVSYDGGAHWTRFDRQALGQSYAINYDMQEPYNVYTGLQDNGTLKGSSLSKPDDLDAWSVVGGGDGMQIEVDPRDSSIYTGYQFGNYSYSGGHDVRPRAPMSEPPYRFNWQTPIRLSQFNSDVLYMGGNKLFRSLDKGKTFEAISGDLTRAKQRGNVPFATITAIAESPKQFGMLWAGTDDGQLWITNDSGSSWRDVGKGLPDAWVAGVEPSHTARFRAYVALNAYRSDDQRALLYVSEDSGRNWRDISAGLPDVPVNVVREDPQNENLLYVGTDRGVYASLDRGKSWQLLGSELPNVPVHDLQVHPRDRELIAGTHGRSVWILDALPLQELSESVRNSAITAFYIDKIKFSRNWKSQPSQWFGHLFDVPESKLSFYAKTAGKGTLSIKTAKGELLREIAFEAKAGLNQMSWDLLVDAEKALALEGADIKARTDKGDLKPDAAGLLNAKETPYTQAKKYQWPQYIQPGEYLANFKLNDASSEVKFSVEAPKAIESRAPAVVKVRGK